MQKKQFILALGLIALTVLAMGAGVFGMFYTTEGSTILTKIALGLYTGSGKISIGRISGNLAHGLAFNDIQLSRIQYLPPETLIKVQKLDFNREGVRFPWINAVVQNGRLKFPGSDTILFYGGLTDGEWGLTVFSKTVGVRQFMDLFSESPSLKNISGRITDLDMRLQGPLLRPQLVGSFVIESLVHTLFTFRDCPGTLDLSVTGWRGMPQLYGYVAVNGGKYYSTQSEFSFYPSKIIYQGNPKEPQLDCRGTTRIKDVEITVVLQGSVEHPDLLLSSNPPMLPEEIMVMLATGTAWTNTRSALQEGQVSADIVKDFVDYFLFAGSGSRFARYLGIDLVSLRYDRQTRGFSLEKEVADKTSIHYGLEQTQQTDEPLVTTHTVGGTFAVNESRSIAIEAAREVELLSPDQPAIKTDDTLMLKFKQKF